MNKQVDKCSVFIKNNLPKIQDKMRDKCIKSFNNLEYIEDRVKDKQALPL